MKNVSIDQSCLDGLVYLLINSSLIKLKLYRCIFSSNNEFDYLITAIATSELKELDLQDIGNDLKMSKSLIARLQTSKTLQTVFISPKYNSMNCSVARLLLLDVAMTQSSIKMTLFFWCIEVLHIYSLGDRVTLFPQFKYYHYYKHNKYYYICGLSSRARL